MRFLRLKVLFADDIRRMGGTVDEKAEKEGPTFGIVVQTDNPEIVELSKEEELFDPRFFFVPLTERLERRLRRNGACSMSLRFSPDMPLVWVVDVAEE